MTPGSQRRATRDLSVTPPGQDPALVWSALCGRALGGTPLAERAPHCTGAPLRPGSRQRRQAGGRRQRPFGQERASRSMHSRPFGSSGLRRYGDLRPRVRHEARVPLLPLPSNGSRLHREAKACLHCEQAERGRRDAKGQRKSSRASAQRKLPSSTLTLARTRTQLRALAHTRFRTHSSACDATTGASTRPPSLRPFVPARAGSSPRRAPS